LGGHDAARVPSARKFREDLLRVSLRRGGGSVHSGRRMLDLKVLAGRGIWPQGAETSAPVRCRQSTLLHKLAQRYAPKRHREPRCADPDAEGCLGIRIRLCTTIGRVLWTHRRYPCAPCSNPGNTPGGRRAAQMARWLAARNPNKSQMFPVKEPNGSRIPPGRSSLPCGKACNASGSSNHVPERTPDQQR